MSRNSHNIKVNQMKTSLRSHKCKTSLLFARPNFFIGMGSAFNVFGNYFLFNYSKSAVEADHKALRNDWGCIGQDLDNVIRLYPMVRPKSVKKDK